ARRSAALAETADDRRFLRGTWISDEQLEQEAVELSFGERIDPLALDRVLRRDDHEAIGQGVGLPIERDAPFLHGFEQCGLSLGRRSVDLVGEQELAEDRPAGERELAGLEVEQVGPDDVARQQVRRELDTAELEPRGGSEALGEESLGSAGRPFEQHMALGEKRSQEVIDSFLLTDDRLADLRADRVGEATGLL